MCYYENGQRVPDIDVLVRIADCFNVSADYLLGCPDVASVAPSQKMQAACEVTGLSEKAIEVLAKEKENVVNNSNIHASCIISDIIVHRLFLDMIGEIIRSIEMLDPEKRETNIKALGDFLVTLPRGKSDVLAEWAKMYARSCTDCFTLIADDTIALYSGGTHVLVNYGDVHTIANLHAITESIKQRKKGASEEGSNNPPERIRAASCFPPRLFAAGLPFCKLF